jgi:hypothetical protein
VGLRRRVVHFLVDVVLLWLWHRVRSPPRAFGSAIVSHVTAAAYSRVKGMYVPQSTKCRGAQSAGPSGSVAASSKELAGQHDYLVYPLQLRSSDPQHHHIGGRPTKLISSVSRPCTGTRARGHRRRWRCSSFRFRQRGTDESEWCPVAHSVLSHIVS